MKSELVDLGYKWVYYDYQDRWSLYAKDQSWMASVECKLASPEETGTGLYGRRFDVSIHNYKTNERIWDEEKGYGYNKIFIGGNVSKVKNYAEKKMIELINRGETK